MKSEKIAGHLLALLTIFIWGTTFVSTKLLLATFSPEEILIIRFSLAFLILLFIAPGKIKLLAFREELLFFALGLTGISLYFWTENIALKFTYASNVGLIVSSIPIFTALISHFTKGKETFSLNLILGFISAFAGLFIIFYNGMALKLNPAGDIMALISAIMFALYSVMITRVNKKHPSLFVTKRIFFYGIVSTLPIAVVSNTDITKLASATYPDIANFLFLSLLASILCFIMWNKSITLIGSIKTTGYIYFVPVITMAFSAMFLGEKITLNMILGGILIFTGVYLNNRKSIVLHEKLR